MADSAYPKTVLVVGAGASCDYGLPCGRGLVQQIKDLLQSKPDDPLRLNVAQGLSEGHLAALDEALHWSRYETIDEFLASASEPIAEVTKRLVAAVLLRGYREFIFKRNHATRDWLGRLVPQLFAAAAPHRLAVVTFNYDTLIEECVLRAIRARAGATPLAPPLNTPKDDVGRHSVGLRPDSRMPFNVIHVHGQLAIEVPGSTGPSAATDYVSPDRITDSASQILVPTDKAADAIWNHARTVISHATRVAFLGFGFFSLNCKRLQLSDLGDNCEILATRRNLTETQLGQIESQAFGGRHITWLKEEEDCLDAVIRLENLFD